jgi:hypothetical protein
MAEIKASRSRIYRVSAGDETKLVRASTANQALAHVARSSFEIAVATQDDCVELVAKGVKVEEARKEEAAEAQ